MLSITPCLAWPLYLSAFFVFVFFLFKSPYYYLTLAALPSNQLEVYRPSGLEAV